ncbi:MAG: S8/S53 family peptidase [Bacteroidia bacterium]
MKNKISTTFLLGVAICMFQPAFSGNGETKNNSNKPPQPFQFAEGVTMRDYEANTIVLKLKPEYRNLAQKNSINIAKLTGILSEIGAQDLHKIFPNHTAPDSRTPTDEMGHKFADITLIYKLNFTKGIAIEKAINQIIATGLVEYAEPYYIYHTFGEATTVEDVKNTLAAFNVNDPSLGQQYFIKKIKCPEAWGVNTTTARGDTNVVIGIVDTGTDLDHPDLKTKIKYNYNDPINGIDDDHDGYIDNFRGWDVSDNDNNPNVDNTTNIHGSHVSGCAAAATNNGVGVASPGFNCKFLPIKAAKKTTTGQIDNGFEAIVYGADHGCSVLNNSYGGPGAGQFGQDIITYAAINKKVLVVASAGNDNKDIVNYPAAYDYVLSIGATDQNDNKSSFSTFTNSVDVCAPGTAIYSTVYPKTYQLMDGTSMAGPITAGAAGIVKSFFPTYTGMQVGEQLRVTADDIYGVGSNKSYKDRLGTGRINLFRALTETTSPSVKMDPLKVTDGNDESFAIGDTLIIKGSLLNYLAATKNLTATLSTTNTDVTILNATINGGVINTMSKFDVDNTNGFKVLIKPSASLNEKILFKVSFADGSYSDRQYFTVIVNVDYINIDINDVSCTNTSRGRIGYNTTNLSEGGLGFNYNDTSSLVYEAGLMIGTSSTKVSDNLRSSSTASDTDFKSVQAVKRRIPTVKSDFETFGVFNDSGASSKIGVEVKHNTYAWTSAGDRKYIIYEYIIKNTSGSALTNLYAGLMVDWDVTALTSGNNKVGADVNNKLGYAYATTGSKLYGGVRVLTNGPFLNYGIDNVTGGAGGFDATTNFTTAEKYTALSTNRLTAGGTTPTGNDIMNVVSTGPFTISSNDTVKVAFAILAGDDLADLIKSSNNAQTKYDKVVTAISDVKLVNGFLLKQNYPNPVNAANTIIEFNLPAKAQAELSIYNTVGQKVMTVLNSQLNAGDHQVNLDVSNFNNGLYFYELTTGNNKAVMKMVIQK